MIRTVLFRFRRELAVSVAANFALLLIIQMLFSSVNFYLPFFINNPPFYLFGEVVYINYTKFSKWIQLTGCIVLQILR